MTKPEKLSVCYHVNVRNLVPELGAAHFAFQVKRVIEGAKVVDEEVEVAIPYAVLESIANSLPQIMADMRSRGLDKIPDAPDPDAQQAGTVVGEILGLSFGSIITELDCVMTGVTVRVHEDGRSIERMGPPMLMNLHMLRDFRQALPVMLQHMKDTGIANDVLPPPQAPVPAWDAGPVGTLQDAKYLCQGLNIRGFDHEQAAALMLVLVSDATDPKMQVMSAAYFLSNRTIASLEPVVANILEKAEAEGFGPTKH